MNIQVQDISKIYGAGESQVTALNHASMTIHSGDFISIIGPSGSGKSTLLHIVSGLDKPTSGSVYYGDTDIHNGSDKQLSAFRRQKIGFIFQQCCICDVAISGTLTWSLITLSSILITWIASFPVILLGKKGVLVAMVAISILILPFMYILNILIKVNEAFNIGAIMSIYTLVFLWIIYILYYRLKERKLLATGITFLFAIPFTLLINITLSKLIGEPVIDVWDILSVFILLIVSVAFIIGDYARKKGFVR